MLNDDDLLIDDELIIECEDSIDVSDLTQDQREQIEAMIALFKEDNKWAIEKSIKKVYGEEQPEEGVAYSENVLQGLRLTNEVIYEMQKRVKETSWYDKFENLLRDMKIFTKAP